MIKSPIEKRVGTLDDKPELKELLRIVNITEVYLHADMDEVYTLFNAYDGFKGGTALALSVVFQSGFIKGVRSERKRRRKA